MQKRQTKSSNLITVAVGLCLTLTFGFSNCDDDSANENTVYCFYEIVTTDGTETGREICDEFEVASGQSKSDYQDWCLAEDTSSSKSAGSFDSDCEVLPDFGDCEASWPDPVTGESVTRIVHYSTGHQDGGDFPAEDNCVNFFEGSYTSAE